jgi:hypothetical protein
MLTSAPSRFADLTVSTLIPNPEIATNVAFASTSAVRHRAVPSAMNLEAGESRSVCEVAQVPTAEVGAFRRFRRPDHSFGSAAPARIAKCIGRLKSISLSFDQTERRAAARVERVLSYPEIGHVEALCETSCSLRREGCAHLRSSLVAPQASEVRSRTHLPHPRVLLAGDGQRSAEASLCFSLLGYSEE